jgi:protein phosphatase
MADSQLADVRALAAQLETWYMAVREEAIPQMVAQQAQAMMPQVDEVTGPLNSASNPSVLISKAKEGVYSTAAELAQALYSLYEANKPLNNLILWSGRASDIGRVRQINEDSLLTIEATVLEHEDSTPIGLYVIADGMGGHQSGEVASSIAARTIGAVVNSALIAPMVEGDPANINAAGLASLLQSAVLEANRRISELARERRSDLGTTVTAAIVLGNQLTVANVGDSRTYLMRDGQLGVITRDHSLVAQLVAAGQLAPDDIYTHPRRNEIYRALGDSHLTDAEVDVFSQRLQPGDAILLCSDGLWDFVRDPVIKGIISDTARKDPQTACNALIDQANTMGGEDNISTILVRVLQMQEEE